MSVEGVEDSSEVNGKRRGGEGGVDMGLEVNPPPCKNMLIPA